MCCVYEGKNTENELYKQLLTQGCDLLIATPTIVNDLIQKRLIHFEQLQMIVVSEDCFFRKRMN
jgi:superfamily II DNA/RNA helicase